MIPHRGRFRSYRFCLTLGPNNQPYYYNAITNESTYVRPLPSFPLIPQAQQAPPSKKKKEKPLLKTPIPGTEWIRVITTEGNTFYTHKAKKESVWTVPDEIKEAVEALEKEEDEEKQRKAEEAQKQEEERMMMEVEKVKADVETMVGKRKAEEPELLNEVVISKKARVEEDVDEEDDEDDEESEEEDWQREAAAQLAAEAEEEKKRQKEEKKRLEEQQAAEEEAAKNRQLNMPARVDLSLEEAKALFKVCIYLKLPSATLL